MSLTPEDVQAIGALLDQRLDQYDLRQRRRRRMWLWFWIGFFVVTTAISMLGAKQLLARLQAQVNAQEQAWSDMKIEYQTRLAQDHAMQAERAEAEKHAKYESAKPQASYEADLMRQSLQLYNRVMQSQAKMKEQQDGDDPEAAIKAGEESLGVMSDALGTLMQVMLRNTDPAHDTLREQAATSDSGAKPTPLDQQLQAIQDADHASAPAPVPAHP